MIRFIVSLSAIVCGFYSLLCAQPFIFQNFIKPQLFPILHSTIQNLPWLMIVSSVLGFFFHKDRKLHFAFVLAMAVAGWALYSKHFVNIDGGYVDSIAAIAFFLVGISIQFRVKDIEGLAELEAIDFTAIALAVIWSSILRLPSDYGIIPWLFTLKALVVIILGAHLNIYRHFFPRFALRLYFIHLFLFLFIGIIFPAISLSGWLAWVAAILLSVGISLNLASLFLLMWRSPRIYSLVLLLVISVASFYLDPMIRPIDWNGAGQAFYMVISTSVAALAISTLFKGKSFLSFRGYHPYLFGVILTFLFLHFGGLEKKIGMSASEQMINKISEFGKPDVSDLQFFQALNENVNVQLPKDYKPVDISFGDVEKAAGRRPPIFIFVIDSLRRDYLSAYNPKVGFTPSFGKFAEESLVFQKAFTRYGGTGLSEPSIWAGAQIPHKQYVTPFAPMNTLEKLLSAQKYTQMVSMDDILQEILDPNIPKEKLDPEKTTRELRLCQTLTEVKSKLDSHDLAQPVFVYTQSQDLHVSVLPHKEGSRSENDFNPEYSAAVNAMDTCFGDFISFLKDKKIYNSSFIVVTADHGDSLGEEGRFGHAYSLYPEVVRVPLLAHVPVGLKDKFHWNIDKVVFNADISATVYGILGLYENKKYPDVFGRPLYETQGRQGPYLLISSYGPVFGLLGENGKDLYIADGISLKDSLYTIDETTRETYLDHESREKYRKSLKEMIDEMSNFYGYRKK